MDSKIQHSNAAALQKILLLMLIHSEEHKMHIHDQNLNVLCDFMFRQKNAQVIQHMLLTHVPSIPNADWFSLCGRFSRNQVAIVCEGHHPMENEDVLGLVVGSWVHFQFLFSCEQPDLEQIFCSESSLPSPIVQFP